MFFRYFRSHGNYFYSHENVLSSQFQENFIKMPLAREISLARSSALKTTHPGLVVDVCTFVNEEPADADVTVV